MHRETCLPLLLSLVCGSGETLAASHWHVSESGGGISGCGRGGIVPRLIPTIQPQHSPGLFSVQAILASFQVVAAWYFRIKRIFTSSNLKHICLSMKLPCVGKQVERESTNDTAATATLAATAITAITVLFISDDTMSAAAYSNLPTRPVMCAFRIIE